MQAIDLNKNFDSKIIQEQWQLTCLPHFTGVVIGDGRIVSMSESHILINGNKECHVHPICESTVSSFMDFSGEFIEVVVMVERIFIPEIDCYVICGEGEMGNEGFIAVIKNDTLIWSFFSTISNPFYELLRDNDDIIAKTTHETYWKASIYEPWNIKVLGESKEQELPIEENHTRDFRKY